MDSRKGEYVTVRTQKPGDAGYITYMHLYPLRKRIWAWRNFRAVCAGQPGQIY